MNAVHFRQSLGEMLNEVQYRNDSIVIHRDGKRDRFDALSDRIAEGYAAIPVEEGLAEIESVVAQERRR